MSAATSAVVAANSTSAPGGSYTNPAVAFPDTSTQRLNGFIGGGQVGFNFQLSPHWVLGLEADIQGSGERGSSNSFTDSFSSSICTGTTGPIGGPFVCNGTVPINGTAMTTYDAKIAWFGTVRGRLGFLIDDVLVYGTGGLAYGKVKVSGNANVNGTVDLSPNPGEIPFGTPGATLFSESKTNVGFALGAGIEGKCSYLLPTCWTWKLEYLYVDLGSFDTVSPFPAATPRVPETGPFIGAITTHTHFTDNIVRVGLNYKFGNYYAPVVAK
jgi:outer membrane immunogenic protein